MKHIVAVLRRRALKIRVGDTNEVFASPEEMARFLSQRTAVPDERMQEFVKYDERTLQREARKMLQAHQNVMDVMVSAKETGEPLSNLWRRLDISKVPDDYDWPSILFALGSGPHIAEAYRREALSQYIRFLEVRRDAIDSFRQRRERSTSGDPSLTAAPPKAAAQDMPAAESGALDGYSRLPHCHVVEVDLEEKSDVTVFLGTNRYHLSRQGESLSFQESEAGERYPLKPGRNTIGRSSHCDVHLEKQLADVSRQHLIVEIGSNRRVNLMDVSSRGTYVRQERLVDKRTPTITEQHS